MRNLTPDWMLTLIWFVAGIPATGAFWYFLSQKNRYAALWACYITVVVVLLAVTLHVRNDFLRRDALSVHADLSAASDKAAAMGTTDRQSTGGQPASPGLKPVEISPPPASKHVHATPGQTADTPLSTPRDSQALTAEREEASRAPATPNGKRAKRPPALHPPNEQAHAAPEPQTTPPVTINAPGGVVSIGQQGGITAKDVTINTNAPPKVLASEQRQIHTNDPKAPWATEFYISSTGLIMTGDLKLKCSGPALMAGIERINPYELITGDNGPDPNDPTAVIYQLSPEILAAGRRIGVAVYSEQPVTVISGSIGGNSIIFQSQESTTMPEPSQGH